jgi:hypothetical protein
VALTRSVFLVRHPEFARVDSAQIDIAIADALNAVDETVLDTEYDRACALHAAHSLSLSPAAQKARLNSWSPDTPYSAQLEALLKKAGGAYRSILD